MTGVFISAQGYSLCLPCHIHLFVLLWIMDPHSRAPKKNTSHANEVLPQDTMHLIQSPCQDPAGNRTTRRPSGHRKETQTAVVWSCLPFIRFGQSHLARHSERGKKDNEDKRKRREDNIREWTGLEFAKFQRAAENRENGRNLVVKSSVVPKRPSRLRDRWWWCWWWW